MCLLDLEYEVDTMKSNNKEVTMRKFNLNIRDKNTFGLVIILFGIILFMSILEPSKFFTFNNFQSMSFQFPEYGILSLGMMACMIAGGIDLSTVGIANLSSVVTATILVKMVPEGTSLGMYAVFAITRRKARSCSPYVCVPHRS